MNLDALLRSRWFYSSPGPISLLYYSVLVIAGAYLLTKRIEYNRHKWILAFSDSFFLNAFIILSGDLFWIVACGIRFLGGYPDSFFQVVSVIGRDAAGIILCYLLIGNYIKTGIVKFKQNVFFAYLLLIVFLIVDFGIAPSPAWTDWTYAIREGYSTNYILASLLFSYGLGKVVSTVLWLSWWIR